MADQYAIQDQNQFPGLIGHSGTSNDAETRRVVVTDAGAMSVDIVSGDSISVSIGTVDTEAINYSKRVDDNGAGTVWIGEADIASNEGSAVWRIKQIVDNSGTVDIKWADGDESFDNIWTGHGTISYS